MNWVLNKREFIAGSAAGALWAAGGRWLARDAASPAFPDRITSALIDESTGLGRELGAEARRAGLRTIRFDSGDEAVWRDARFGFGLASGDAMIGLTGWSDWTILRPVLAGHRKLARAELRIDATDMPVGELVGELGNSLSAEALDRRRFGGTGSARTQFAWLVA